MSPLTRIYLRGSTDAQDATRAREQVEAFAAEHGLTVAATYIENASGAKLARPELLRMLADSKPSDIVLVEAVDRLARLTDQDWKALRREIESKGVRIISLDLPTSWTLAKSSDDFTGRVMSAINSLMLDVLAAVARADYEMRRRRAAQGIEAAKKRGAYKGRPENVSRNAGIAAQLRGGASWTSIQKSMNVSRATINKISKRMSIAAE
jgi:DNA invertase Pin-like site-specific DNA recombinase